MNDEVKNGLNNLDKKSQNDGSLNDNQLEDAAGGIIVAEYGKSADGSFYGKSDVINRNTANKTNKSSGKVI